MSDGREEREERERRREQEEREDREDRLRREPAFQELLRLSGGEVLEIRREG